MTGAGSSLMGQGTGTGKTRARDAALAATSSPLLDVGIERARGIVWNVTGPPDMSLAEVNAAAEVRKRKRREGEKRETEEEEKLEKNSKIFQNKIKNTQKKNSGRLRPRRPRGQPHLRRRRGPGPGGLGRALDHSDRDGLRRGRAGRLGRRAVCLFSRAGCVFCSEGCCLGHRRRRSGGARDSGVRRSCRCFLEGRARDRDPGVPPSQARQVDEERRRREKERFPIEKRQKQTKIKIVVCFPPA